MTTPSTRGRTPMLLAFVLLVFCTGTAEFLVAGLLPQLAGDLHISEALAGQASTVYAIGVAIGGPVVTVATARLPRKGLALALAALFLLGLVVTACATTLPLLFLGRVVSSLSQAPLFAIGLIAAAESVRPQHAGRAIAFVTSGLTIATVLGVPLGALLGSAGSWRVPFVVIAVTTTAALVLLALTMPRTPAPTAGVVGELGALWNGAVLLAVATTAVGYAGVATVFVYLVPLLTGVTGFAPAVVPALLFAYGAGGFVGNLAAGRLADRSLRVTLLGALGITVLVLALLPLAAPQPVATLVLTLALGVISTATIAPLQTLLLQRASSAPTLALATNVSAFMVANATGAALGGVLLAAGLVRIAGWYGAGLALVGLGLAAFAVRGTANGTMSDREH